MKEEEEFAKVIRLLPYLSHPDVMLVLLWRHHQRFSRLVKMIVRFVKWCESVGFKEHEKTKQKMIHMPGPLMTSKEPALSSGNTRLPTLEITVPRIWTT